MTGLVIDEAQAMPDELLEEVRLLANIETATDKLLPIVLAGQPELADRLNQVSLRQLKQRVALRCLLLALDAKETAEYIAGRIRVAGGNSVMVFTRAGGRCRSSSGRAASRGSISVICDNALISGFAADRRPVGRDIVEDVCRDFDLRRPCAGTRPSTSADATAQRTVTAGRALAPAPGGRDPPGPVAPVEPAKEPAARAQPVRAFQHQTAVFPFLTDHMADATHESAEEREVQESCRELTKRWRGRGTVSPKRISPAMPPPTATARFASEPDGRRRRIRAATASAGRRRPRRGADVEDPPWRAARSRAGRRRGSRYHAASSEKLSVNSGDPTSTEQYRRLAGRLYLAQAEHGTRVVMVTSAMPGEGKTLTATNLALTLAESYKRQVLLIDADLRRPWVHEMFQVPNLSGPERRPAERRGPQDSAAALTDNLSVLTAGRPDRDPMSVLSSDRMRRVLRRRARASTG